MINGSILEHVHEHGFKEEEIYGAYKIFFGTLVSESRLKIINLLRNKKSNVTEIMAELKTNQTSASHDLARLRQCGFVKAKREGKFVYYSLSKDIERLMSLIDEHMKDYCVHILHRTKGEENGR